MPIQIQELKQLVPTEPEHDEPTPYVEDDRQMLCLLFGAGARRPQFDNFKISNSVYSSFWVLDID